MIDFGDTELVLDALQLVEAHPLPHIMCPRYRLDDFAPALGSDVLCPSIHPFNWPHSDFSPGCDVLYPSILSMGHSVCMYNLCACNGLGCTISTHPFNWPPLCLGNAVWTELMYFGRETHYNNFGIGDDEQLMITEF